MNYFQLRDDVEFPGRWTLGDPETDRGCDPFDLTRGRSAVIGEPTVEVQQPGVPLAFTMTVLDVPLATDQLAAAIASVAGQDLQRIPVRIGSRIGYQILNALRAENCLDESRSEFLKWTDPDGRPDKVGEYRMVTRLHIDARKLPPEAHFFRVEGWLVALIVSEDVKRAMERAGCSGARFIEVT